MTGLWNKIKMSDQSINFASPNNDVCRAFFALEFIFGSLFHYQFQGLPKKKQKTVDKID